MLVSTSLLITLSVVQSCVDGFHRNTDCKSIGAKDVNYDDHSSTGDVNYDNVAKKPSVILKSLNSIYSYSTSNNKVPMLLAPTSKRSPTHIENYPKQSNIIEAQTNSLPTRSSKKTTMATVPSKQPMTIQLFTAVIEYLKQNLKILWIYFKLYCLLKLDCFSGAAGLKILKILDQDEKSPRVLILVVWIVIVGRIVILSICFWNLFSLGATLYAMLRCNTYY